MTLHNNVAILHLPSAAAAVVRRGRVPRMGAAMLAGLAALFLGFQPGRSAQSPMPVAMKPGDVHAGSLLLKRGDDSYAEAVRLGLDVELVVSGPTVRARVTQAFRNPTKYWVEAVYAYPLPNAGAVDTLKMVVGDRVIVGNVKERVQARAVYEQAKREGHKAALVEQERPNIFTNAVANIGPGETVLVQIEYQEPVRQSGDEFSLRVPLVIGPRYNPAPVAQSVDLRPDGGGWGAATNSAGDQAPPSPQALDPAVSAPVNSTLR